MALTAEQIELIVGHAPPLAAATTYYHWTADQLFFEKVTGERGMGTRTQFLANYMEGGMSQTRQGGPGLYVCTNQQDSASYGHLLIEARATAGVKLLDVAGGMPQVFKNKGFSLQDILTSTDLPLLIKYRTTFIAIKTHKGIGYNPG